MNPILPGRADLPLGQLIAKYDRRVPRYTSYPPITAWRDTIGAADYGEALETAGRSRTESLSLYLHLPFCPRRCLYCGCNVEITRRPDRVDAYLDRLARELDLVVAALGRGCRVVQLHLGGGTPNQLTGIQLERLRRLLDERFDLASNADTSIEADPRLASPEQFRAIRTLGFQRISFGVQDLDPEVQQAIGRVQPAERVGELVLAAREAGFTGINLDLIYGLPRQTLETFQRTLDVVADLAPDRIACFGYAHVPAMRPHQRALERYPLPSAEERFALNALAAEQLTAAGYRWIGLDHFALPADSLAVAAARGRLHRNFNGYTTMPASHLLGFGMSAIGEVGGLMVQNDGDLAGWAAAIEAGRLATIRGHRPTADDRRRRAAILQLMCHLEIPVEMARGLERELAALEASAADGLVERRGDRVAVTTLGRYFLRTLCTAFDASLPEQLGQRPMSRAV